MEAEHQIAKLIAIYLQGKLTVEQRSELDSWLNISTDNRQLFQTIIDSFVNEAEQDVDGQLRRDTWEKIMNQVPELSTRVRPRVNWRRWSVAAGLAVVGFSGWYFYKRLDSDPIPPAFTNYKKPVKERAILRLADNNEIALDAVGIGMLSKRGDISIHKVEDGRLVYSTDSSSIPNSKTQEEGYNTISTSKGSQYQVRLPDGTMVWLNAVSTLRFPVHFSGWKREVFVTGEAYFEVSQQPLPSQGNKKKIFGAKKKPFIVHANGTQVEVLGTHFNISAYMDETVVKTTLLEGKVKVRSSIHSSKHTTLRPGQQATSSKNGQVTISYPNLDDVISWKKGIIIFELVPLQEIMRQVARWHDVEIVYEGPVTRDKFCVGLFREQSLPGILKALSLTEKFSYRIDGKRVVIMP